MWLAELDITCPFQVAGSSWLPRSRRAEHKIVESSVLRSLRSHNRLRRDAIAVLLSLPCGSYDGGAAVDDKDVNEKTEDGRQRRPWRQQHQNDKENRGNVMKTMLGLLGKEREPGPRRCSGRENLFGLRGLLSTQYSKQPANVERTMYTLLNDWRISPVLS